LEQAVKLLLINRNPADYVDAPKKEKKEIVVLSEQEVKLLLDAVKDSYLYMPVFLAIYTGMRMGEILGLTWQDVDLNRGVIQVKQNLYQRTPGEPLFKRPKTPGSRRTIDISPIVVKTLREHKKNQAKERLAWGEGYKNYNLVCCLQNGDTINPPTLSSRFRKIAQRLGLFVTFHGLRHVHAALLLKINTPPKIVSERLGHSQISITQDLYSHVMPGMQKEAARQLEELLK
jgi:integrase